MTAYVYALLDESIRELLNCHKFIYIPHNSGDYDSLKSVSKKILISKESETKAENYSVCSTTSI